MLGVVDKPALLVTMAEEVPLDPARIAEADMLTARTLLLVLEAEVITLGAAEVGGESDVLLKMTVVLPLARTGVLLGVTEMGMELGVVPEITVLLALGPNALLDTTDEGGYCDVVPGLTVLLVLAVTDVLLKPGTKGAVLVPKREVLLAMKGVVILEDRCVVTTTVVLEVIEVGSGEIVADPAKEFSEMVLEIRPALVELEVELARELPDVVVKKELAAAEAGVEVARELPCVVLEIELALVEV